MNEYTKTKKCPDCGGPIFKYANISDDTYHLVCGHTSVNYSDVNDKGFLRKYVETPAKKLPCGFKKVLTEIKNDTIYTHPQKVASYTVPDIHYQEEEYESDFEEYESDNEEKKIVNSQYTCTIC